MCSVIELNYFINLLNNYESGLVKIIKFHTKDIKKLKQDTKHIKKARTAYCFYVRSQIPLMRDKISFGMILKTISVNWKVLLDKEKDIYKHKELEDKKRYNKELIQFLMK